MSDEGNTFEEPVPAEEPEAATQAEPEPEPAPEPPAPPESPAAAPVAEEPPAAWAPPPTPPPPPPPPIPPTPPYAPPVEVVTGRPGPVTDSSKLLAALGYVFPIIAIIVFFVDPYKNETFVRFHAAQGIALWVLGVVFWIPVIGWILGIIAFVVAVIALIKAFQGEYWEIPVLYDIVKSFIGE